MGLLFSLLSGQGSSLWIQEGRQCLSGALNEVVNPQREAGFKICSCPQSSPMANIGYIPPTAADCFGSHSQGPKDYLGSLCT